MRRNRDLDNDRILVEERNRAMAMRRDIVPQEQPEVVKAVVERLKSLQARQTHRSLATDLDKAQENRERFRVRTTLLEPPTSDPNGLERTIGRSDLLTINFLARGTRAAAAVCRVRVPSQGGEWYGTGFLVGPRLLMTNNHVLSSIADADQAEAEFNYEHDADGVLNPPIQFNLAPAELFFTDIEYDVTFVGVAPLSDGGIPLERFGYLPLLPLSGKGLDEEWVTSIQHPGGQAKQMTVRACQIIELDPKVFKKVPEYLIHYTTDTEPGSSGSPVVNDQWQVIAIHHKAVRKPKEDSADNNGAGAVLDPKEDEWLANEGVRVSAIYRQLESKRLANKHAAGVLDRLSRAIGIMPLQIAPATRAVDPDLEKDVPPFAAQTWEDEGDRLGYKADFLPVEIDLEQIIRGKKGKAIKLKGSDKVILDYLHFSTVISSERYFPIITAVNINGSKLQNIESSGGPWRHDIRIDEPKLPGNNFYVAKLGNDRVDFQRGHLVRRVDPCWGSKTDAKLAEKHTFHFTNAAPHFATFNNVDWGDLEDYVLDRTQTLEKKVTVFSGAIFRDQDPDYGLQREKGPWQIPTSYWKIAVIEKPNEQIAAAAFIVGQVDYLKALFEARVFTGLNPYRFDELKERKLQVPVGIVEQETGLDFSMLREFDAQDALESTRRTRFLESNDEIII